MPNFPRKRKPNKKTYKRFLSSPYWKAVRTQVVKRDRYKCKNCGATKYLQVHHKTYSHHGKEHLHLKDLETLCRSCHKKQHRLK